MPDQTNSTPKKLQTFLTISLPAAPQAGNALQCCDAAPHPSLALYNTCEDTDASIAAI
jgi:hypothetical protein